MNKYSNRIVRMKFGDIRQEILDFLGLGGRELGFERTIS